MASPLSAHGQRVVEALGAGRRFGRRRDGWAAGPLQVPEGLVAELERRDLVRRRGDALDLRPAGQAWLRRRAGSDNRLLVERALPQDAREAPDACPAPDAQRGRAARSIGQGGAPRPAAPARLRRSVTVNLAESPLGWLKARGLVDARQYEAGERLRGDWTVAQIAPRTTMRWEAGAPSTGDRLDPTVAQLAARRRMDEALDAVGPGLRDVLWRIVCAGEGMATAEQALGWPARAGRVVLTLALDRLADRYGLR